MRPRVRKPPETYGVFSGFPWTLVAAGLDVGAAREEARDGVGVARLGRLQEPAVELAAEPLLEVGEGLLGRVGVAAEVLRRPTGDPRRAVDRVLRRRAVAYEASESEAEPLARRKKKKKETRANARASSLKNLSDAASTARRWRIMIDLTLACSRAKWV